MSVLGEAAAHIPGKLLGSAGMIGIGVGIAAGVTNSKATNSIFSNMFNAVVGRPGDGTIGADEAILGRPLDASSFINPLARFIPGTAPQSMKYARYALQPGKGILNPAMVDYGRAVQSYEQGDYLRSQVRANVDQRVGNSRSSFTRNNASAFTGMTRYNRSQNLNADGAIVFGLHNGRY